MAAIYLGFDLSGMLYWINKYSEKVQVSSEGDGWRLYVLSEEYGEFELSGSLFNITTKAFKPFAEKAKNERKERNRQLQQIVYSVTSEPNCLEIPNSPK